MNNAKADAALYLLTGLLQRLEVDRPGMLQEMIEGVSSVRASLRENTENRQHIDKVFDDAMELLTRANIA